MICYVSIEQISPQWEHTCSFNGDTEANLGHC